MQKSRLINCLITSFLLLFVMMILSSCNSNVDHTAAVERHKKLAGELRDNRLYKASVDEYKNVLEIEDIDNKERANINYLIGRIYFENLLDYENAAAYYVKAQSLDSEAPFSAEASRKLVASLEKMGNVVDAKRQLDAVVNLDGGPKDDNDPIVAKIGTVPIYMSEIDDYIQQLPPESQKQFLNPQAKVEFMRQHVGMELIYHAAVRENYDDDAEIKKQQQLFNKQLLINKYVVDKVMPQIKIDTNDVKNFYRANKDLRYKDAPYDSVKAQVFMDYQSEKTQSAFQDYISMLAQKEKVEFLDQNVR